MPSSREALALTDAYRSRLLQARQYAASVTARAWQGLDLRDLDGSFGTWLATAEAVVGGAKRHGVTVSDHYLAAFVAAETGDQPRPRALDPDPYLPTVDGRPLRQALATPLLTVKSAIGAGRTDDALRLGQARATRIVAVEVLDAPRRALGDLMREEDRIVGWHRVVSANACGACLALASGDRMEKDAHVHTHSSCRCIAEPEVARVEQRYRRPSGREIFDAMTPEEQARLFAGRGGAEKADLVRSGAVPFDALVKRERQEVTPDQFTEASLDDLRAIAPAHDAPGHDHQEDVRRDA